VSLWLHGIMILELELQFEAPAQIRKFQKAYLLIGLRSNEFGKDSR
jgi:hypothetical protein